VGGNEQAVFDLELFSQYGKFHPVRFIQQQWTSVLVQMCCCARSENVWFKKWAKS